MRKKVERTSSIRFGDIDAATVTSMTMKLDLFSKGDNVLLLGEGNFSFARDLFTHNLPINITATCCDAGQKYNYQEENIKFLTGNNVPVFIDVDATNLSEHPILKNQIFSKIIFNFPHVGGKMKIQLNRDLIKNICQSSSQLLVDDGMMLVSLCNGQGGTPADNPQRKWDDSWQITEMAAYGDLCLMSVDLFDFDNFPNYNCTGYRSQDSHFNLKGALVHVLKKRVKPSRLVTDEVAAKRLSCLPLYRDSDVLVPFYYAELFHNNPLRNHNSPLNFFKDLLCDCFEDLQTVEKLILLEDECSLVFFSDKTDLGSEVNMNERIEVSSAAQITCHVLDSFQKYCSENEVLFIPGMFINFSLSKDFHYSPPISLKFLLVGKGATLYFHEFMKKVKSVFDRGDLQVSCEKIYPCKKEEEEEEKSVKESLPDCELIIEWTFGAGAENILAHELHLIYNSTNLKLFIIYMDKFIDTFFHTRSWKEKWREDVSVSHDSKSVPVLNHCLIYPSKYKFDVTLRYDSTHTLRDDEVYEVLRLSAIDLIREVEMMSEYTSGTGWSSKCYRITYECLSEPFHREKALEIHSKLICKMLAMALPVTI